MTKLKASGMPVHSVEAARAWRRVHLNPARCKPEPRPAGADALREVAELGDLAERALQVARFHLIEPVLRAALRRVPLDHRPRVALSVPVWDALVRPVTELIAQAADDEPASLATQPSLSDDEAEAMGRFWYSIAADGRAANPD